MRPDPHKQAASRKYHQKLKSKGVAPTTSKPTSTSDTPSQQDQGRNTRGRGGGSHRGRGGHSIRGYTGQGNHQNHDKSEQDDSDDGAPRKSYARRKITSNADRYAEPDVEDQKKTFDPAAYFRFKSEKDVENQDAVEETMQAKKLLEVRLDDVERALMTLSIRERLFLSDSDAKMLDKDTVGKVSFATGKPIVPKLVRGQTSADILIKPTGEHGAGKPTLGGSNRAVAPTNSQSRQAVQGIHMNDRFMTSQQSMSLIHRVLTEENICLIIASFDEDLNDLLDVTKSYGKAKNPLPASLPPQASITTTATPQLASIRPTALSSANPRRALPPLTKKKSTPAPPATAHHNDEEWLDSVLG
ncbi:hypothetical protein BG004_006878 [Podila humilis]|nr:hypothetical protein BG004_006878 [Podila humilis]